MKNNKDTYIKVGKKIKEKRIELGLSQAKLAIMATPKLDRSKISDIENGKEDFMFSTLLRICGILKIEVEDLFKD